MNVNDRHQYLIKKYLKNELTENELNELKEELHNNKTFKSDFIFQQSLQSAVQMRTIKDTIAQARIENILENKKDYPQFKSVKNSIDEARLLNLKLKKRQHLFTMVKTGAVAASILIFGLFVWNNNIDDDIAKDLAIIYNDVIHGKEQDFEIQEVGARSEVIEYKLEKLNQAQSENDFNDALTILSELKDIDYSPLSIQYYEAVLLTQKTDYSAGLIILDKLASENTTLKDDSRWLQSLIYLKLGDKANAQKYLHLLSKESEKYKLLAEKKLRKHF